ncbi:MAG: hypothetical protein LBD73_00910 [Deferribacteraceae bacterium]|jgi:type II secretory pathway pseudopilin PulG|nr:hypothetical protein [Deferribacteraceae bacterium]
MKKSFIENTECGLLKNRRWAAFSLFELAIVLVVMGLIAAISARAIPTLNQQSRAIELGSELRNYTESVLGRAVAERSFQKPDNFSAVNFPHYNNYTDSNGNNWGYIVARDMTSPESICSLDPKKKILVIHCNVPLASCNTGSAVESFVEDVALVMFSSDDTFKERVRFYTRMVELNPTNYSMSIDEAIRNETQSPAAVSLSSASYNDNADAYNAVIMKIGAPANKDPVDDTVLEYTYQEVWDRLGCPPVRSMTEGDVLSTRGANYAVVDMLYDFVPVPINFLDAPGAEYCFETYEGRSPDFGLAQTYERDVWSASSESSYKNSGTGYAAGGGVDSASIAMNSRNSNYCNRANNRMPTVNNCSGLRAEIKWEGSRINFPKWYKDEMKTTYAYKITTTGTGSNLKINEYTELTTPQELWAFDDRDDSGNRNSTPYTNGYGFKKWFLCGGNGSWDELKIGGNTDLDDYEIRLRPGYRGSDVTDFYRINNRSFKAYARIPGSRAIYKQSFTMTVRGTTLFYEYGWPVNPAEPE